jgi:hypothetical protein
MHYIIFRYYKTILYIVKYAQKIKRCHRKVQIVFSAGLWFARQRYSKRYPSVVNDGRVAAVTHSKALLWPIFIL